ncbi:hypothetical protein [Sphingosinithalassobacter sp. LHW66-3]|uniref:hypothetical protein n=1 Tax=Sphingosinithalassobacter sp. LHW66-3 TaxID=3424718 RepID=UPI003D6A320B
MKLLPPLVALLALTLGLLGCNQSRRGGELRLKHSVTVMTPDGPRSFFSVVSLDGIQAYNHGFGGSGWGAISCTLTGEAVRVPIGGSDFYFLLARPGGYTPAWTQIKLVKSHFGLPNHTDDARWVKQWRALAQSGSAVDLAPEAFPAIAVMPAGGWMNDARLVSPAEAETLGLHVLRYRLEITREPVGAYPGAAVRYRERERTAPNTGIGRELFTVVDGIA